jgi:hypothetical protein
MLNRLTHRKDDGGQALIVVIALVAISAILILALEVSVLGDSKVSANSTSQEQALQAAQAGLADYQTYVGTGTPQWSYASEHCSVGTFGSAITGVTSTGPCNIAAGGTTVNGIAYTGLPDPGNRGMADVPETNCRGGSATARIGTPGTTGYMGWVTTRGNTSGFVEQYQYVVDSSLATPSAGYVHIFVTGRAGRSGHFTCTTVKALYNGPQYSNNVSTTFLTPVACNGQPLSHVGQAPQYPGDPVAKVMIQTTGGTGETGGTGSSTGSGVGIQGVQSTGGGAGGAGETVTATYSATATTSLSINIGCQAGSPINVAVGGAGFSSGGSSSGNAGGGGGSTAVCLITASFPLSDCTASYVTSTSRLASNVFMVAGGGGAGGSGRALASGAGAVGGTGVSTVVAGLGVAENGSNGFMSAYANGTNPGRAGTGGAGGLGTAAYAPAGRPGNVSTSNSDGGSDGGAGGGGYTGGSGGGPGWGGGGGGAGSSFFNTTAVLGYQSGTGAFVGQPRPATAPNAGQVTITWLDSAGNTISTDSPLACGMTGASTSVIPAFATVELQILGTTGGQGTVLGRSPFGNTSNGGAGSSLVATYLNTSASPVYVTTVQGCNGAIGLENGPTSGGSGLGNGGANCTVGNCGLSNLCGSNPCSAGNAGSGGGATTICISTTAPTAGQAYVNQCCPTDITSAASCTVDTSTLLMVAGGGGGGGGSSALHNAHTPGGDGGAGGIGTNLTFTPSVTNVQTGLVTGIAGGGGIPGIGGGTAYVPDGLAGSPGTLCGQYGGDGGGGGGGYGGGGGGGPGTTFGGNGGCQNQGAQAGGGGGGSSYLCPPSIDGGCTGPLQLQKCPPGAHCLYSPCVSSSTSPFGARTEQNTSTQPLDEAEWCPAPVTPTGGATGTLIGVQSSPPMVLSQSPTAVPTTPQTVIW